MSWRIIVCFQGEYLKLKLDNLIIIKKGIDYSIPLSDISIVVVEGLDTVISTRLLGAMAEYNIGLVTCNNKHEPCGIYLNYNGHSRSSKMLKWQMSWSNVQIDKIWAEIIKYKILNQLEVLRAGTKEIDAIEHLKKYLQEVQDGDKTNREGLSAKVYFKGIFGTEFIRGEDDILNGCLNYGYTILRSYLAKVCVAFGLDCRIGVFHKSEFNNFCLVDDLMEPFRPFFDYYIITKFKDRKFMDQKMRYEIIDILNIEIKVENRKTRINYLIEKYVESFISSMKVSNVNKLIYPEIGGYIEVCNEV